MGWILRLDVPAPIAEPLTSMLWDHHTTGVAELETSDRDPGAGPDSPGWVTLVAGFDTRDAALAARAMVHDHQRVDGAERQPWTIDVETVDPLAWVDPDRRAVVDVAGRRFDLDVGPAFGHGGHPTTRLALDALAQWQSDRSLDEVLDVGTGTGVLALAAAAHGASGVVAAENDPPSEVIARHNVAAADLADVITVVDDLDHPKAVGPFDVVVANVLLTVHRLVGAGIAERVRPGGLLIVSGAIAEQRGELEQVYASLGPARYTATTEGWVALGFSPPAAEATDAEAAP